MADRQFITKLALLFMLALFSSSLVFAAIPSFEAYEGEVLYLNAETFDIDGDFVVTKYPSPFDSTGRWLTNFDDAGEYVLQIEAEDEAGHVVYQDFRLTVLETNQEPYLESSSFTFSEGEFIDLQDILVDPDNDVLRYSFTAPFSEEGTWQTSFDDAGRYVVDVMMDDGEFSLVRQLEVVIEDVNAEPFVHSLFEEDGISFTANEGELLDVFVVASDFDNDPISYEWFLDDEKISTDPSFDLRFDFDSGDDSYVLSLKISDGNFEKWYSWNIFVNNVNRAPETQDLFIHAQEGETIDLSLAEKDLDGDEMSYTFDQYFDSNGMWNVDYERAGEIEVFGSASDGELSSTFTVYVTVEDTDRAPAVYGSPSYFGREGEVLSFSLESEDKDGDSVTFSAVSGLPDGATLNPEGLFVWDIPYTFIERNENIVSNFLNWMRFESMFLSSKEMDMRVKACGKSECSFATITLNIANTNQAPEFVSEQGVVISETQEAIVLALAQDADNDKLKYYFEEPLDSQGKWQTGFEDEGAYYTTVTVSDGYLYDTQTFEIIVEKENREPWFTLSKDYYKVLEGEEVKFHVSAEDLDSEDDLEITLVSGPAGSWFGEDGTYSWVPTHDVVLNKSETFMSDIVGKNRLLSKWFSKEIETVWLEFMVDDGYSQIIMPVSIDVVNVNRAPTFADLNPGLGDVLSYTSYDEPVDFMVDAVDADGDALQYTWKFSGVDFNRIEGPSTISRVFSFEGSKKVSVRVCDGRDCVMQEWTLDVIGEEMIVDTSSNVELPEPEVQIVEKVVYVDNSDSRPAPTYGMYVVENWE